MVQRLAGLDARKVLVGLTGTFGSGKSTVAKFLEELGAFVIDSDILAREAFSKGSPVYQEIVSAFPEAGCGSGALDRAKIAGIAHVF